MKVNLKNFPEMFIDYFGAKMFLLKQGYGFGRKLFNKQNLI